MGAGQPFMYDPVPKETSKHPYNSFDPKAVSRASLTPKPPKPNQDGPLLSFNKHPDSYLVVPYGNTNAKPMNRSIKSKVKWTRIIQLILRCLELLGAIGLLVTMILITGIEPVTAWLMRIPPGVAILHNLYSIYHLGRPASGRTPASSASYMLFAAGFDVSLIPFYAFAGLMASAQFKLSSEGVGGDGEWNTLLPAGQYLVPQLSGTAFLCSVIAGGLHVFSLIMSLWLAATFRKITKLPPDMNPLEDNLTSRHKRNKSSISAISPLTMSEKRLSEPLESKRNSGAPYETLSRPPTIPFMHTRQDSTESFSTYHTTPPASRDSRLDLPSRQYQIHLNSNSPRSSVTELKRSSVTFNNAVSPPKRGSYVSLPVSDKETSDHSHRSSRQLGTKIPEAWQSAESMPPSERTTRSRSSSPIKGGTRYHPLHQNFDAEAGDVAKPSRMGKINTTSQHPNPLEANPPTPRLPPHRTNRGSALSEIGYNNGSAGTINGNKSGDLADISLTMPYPQSSHHQDPEKPWGYGKQQQQQQQQENAVPNYNSTLNSTFKARYYGDLKSATPPIILGSDSNQMSSGNGTNGRQVSSGNDYSVQGQAGKWPTRRDVSGKIAEEGRSIAGAGTWGTRFRKMSGRRL